MSCNNWKKIVNSSPEFDGLNWQRISMHPTWKSTKMVSLHVHLKFHALGTVKYGGACPEGASIKRLWWEKWLQLPSSHWCWRRRGSSHTLSEKHCVIWGKKHTQRNQPKKCLWDTWDVHTLKNSPCAWPSWMRHMQFSSIWPYQTSWIWQTAICMKQT